MERARVKAVQRFIQGKMLALEAARGIKAALKSTDGTRACSGSSVKCNNAGWPEVGKQN